MILVAQNLIANIGHIFVETIYFIVFVSYVGEIVCVKQNTDNGKCGSTVSDSILASCFQFSLLFFPFADKYRENYLHLDSTKESDGIMIKDSAKASLLPYSILSEKYKEF